jgi:capsular exopolysaccharide synthesis family protein
MIEPAFVHELRGYLAVLHKRRALVATCVIVSLVVAVLYNYTTRPLYQATAQIRIDRETPDILPSKELMRVPITPDYLLTEYQLLAGREMAERAVEELDLQKSEEFQTGPLVSPWERLQKKFLGRNPAALTDSDGIPLSPAIAAFRSRLSIEPIAGSRLVNIRFTAYNPQIAARAANTLAKLYIIQSQEFRSNTSNEATGWLSDRLKEQQAKLDKAERALQEYREREGILNADEKQEIAGQKMSSINAAILTARTQRIAKESLLAQIRALSPSQLASSAAVANLPGVAALRLQRAELLREQARLTETLGERHPEMVRNRADIRALDDRIAAEIETAVRTVEAEAQAAREQEGVLQASLEVAKRETFDLNRKSGQYGTLKREVESNQEILRGLLTRSKQSGLEGEMTHSNIRIVEEADVPRGPLWPQKTRNYELALLMGLGLGIGLCLLFEHLDNTFKTPDDVKQHLGLPFLGMVPDVSQRSRGTNAPRPSPLILRSPKSAVAEAYRVLRTNLIFSTADRTGHVLAISSANPGEGKTTTVANLAASLAINGSRVLAVDADLRRPTMHQHFGLAKTPGLSDLIVGKCRPSEAIHKTQFGGLQVLPCGYVPPNPTELLGSASLREIVAALRTHYDWILIDTPPILAMADTAVLCPLVDGVAIVVGAEQSTRPAVQRSVDQIKSVNGRMLGVILNKVNFERNSYYYGQYYGEYYRSYYAEKQDDSRTSRAAGARPLRRM